MSALVLRVSKESQESRVHQDHQDPLTDLVVTGKWKLYQEKR
jgi:hypothetical protein